MQPAGFCLDAFVFSPGGDASPDVALGLVLLQHPLYLEVQGPVEGGQAFAEVLMYGGFADAELPGGGPHRGTVLYDVKRQPAGAFLDVPFQAATLLHSFTGGVYEGGPTDISAPAGKGLVM